MTPNTFQLDDPVLALDWSPDGRRLAVAGISGPCAVVDTTTGIAAQRLAGHPGGTLALSWSAKGDLIATGGQDGKVKLWVADSGALLRELDGGAAWVEHVAFSPDGGHLATTAGKRLRLWKANGELAFEFAAHESTVSALQWRADGKGVATACYGKIRCFRIGEPKPYEMLDWKASLLSLAWSPNGRYLASSTQENTIQFFRLPSAGREPLQMTGYPSKVKNLAWDRTATFLASGGGEVITVWNVSGQGPAGSLPLQLVGHPKNLSALAYQRRGELKEIERIGLEIEQLLKQVPGATDIVADRIVGKPYLEFEIDRDRIARYGVSVRDVQDVIEIAIGGMNIMESVEGRERYPIRVRYLREFREDLPELEKILVPSSTGVQIPLAQVLTIKSVLGPQEIKGERGLLVGYVTMNTRERDEVSVVEDAEALLQGAVRDGRLKLPPGYYWEWSGQFENQVRATKRMSILVPLCMFIMFVMLYLGFKRWWIAPIIFFGILVSASGGFIMLALWGVNLSVAVWVGFLVLFGVVDDDGVIISTYLENIFDKATFNSVQDVRDAVVQAGLKRIRPCLMTISTTIFGLMPIFWATGRGSDVMQPMAIPSVGGMVVSVLVTIFIAPCLFCAVEEWKWKRAQRLAPKGAIA